MSAVLRWTGSMAAVAVALGAITLGSPAAAEQPPPDVPFGQTYDASGPGQAYVVTLDDTTRVRDVVPAGVVLENLTGPAFRGAVVQLTGAEANTLSEQPGVVAVEKDAVMTIDNDAQPAAVAGTWGLDRTDQRTLPLNGDYSPPANGAGVHAYIIDSGLNANSEFAGRVGNGAYHPDVGTDTSDCNGHGTHVTGTIGSSTYGMAPGVIVHPVRVFDCSGSGMTSITIQGINWVAANAPARSVVNLSLGGGYSTASNTAVAGLVARGLAVIVAAGNDGAYACNYSPASEPSVLTVGATDSDDWEADFSNYGSCLDLYAPGVDILSTNYLGGSGLLKDGTSMAAPHVAGAAAIYWELHPEASGAGVQDAVISQATTGEIYFPYGPGGSPDRLLNVQWPPTTVPGAPGGVTASAQNGQATVTWTPPSSDGGTPITNYTVVTSTGQPGCDAGLSTSCLVQGLSNGTPYQFAVVAQNGRGASAPSAWSATVVPAGPPDAPWNVKVLARKGKAKVSWKAPGFNGGAPISRYTVTASSGRSCSTSGLSCTVKRLKHRKKVRFTVVASNAVGTGPGAATRKVRIK